MKRIFIRLLVIAIITGLISCNAAPSTTPIPTDKPVPAIESPTASPNLISTNSIFLPTSVFSGPFPTGTPYPTAQTVKAGAVALIAGDWQNNKLDSLWVANVDGSGEKELISTIDDSQYRPDSLKWSTNGKWISYESGNDIWLVSPDGSINRKISSSFNKDTMLLSYEWSPDSSRIAYIRWESAQQSNEQHFVLSILDIASERVSVLAEYDVHTNWSFVSWSPDGQYLLYTRDNSFYVAEATSGKTVRIISGRNPNCMGSAGIHRLMWSPNSEWFYYIHSGTGTAGIWSCVGGLDGSIHNVAQGNQSLPAWDNTGRYLYVVVVDSPPLRWEEPYEPDQRLLRYDAATQQVERLISFRETNANINIRSVSVSPDGHTLETHTAIRPTGETFLLLDPASMTASVYTTGLEIQTTRYLDDGTAWSSGSQKIVFYSGGLSTPDGVSIRDYVAFYTLDVHTGKTSAISGEHWMKDWVASPPVAAP